MQKVIGIGNLIQFYKINMDESLPYMGAKKLRKLRMDIQSGSWKWRTNKDFQQENERRYEDAMRAIYRAPAKVKSVIIYETEIWLNFYKVCNKYNIKLCIVNARLQKNLHKKKFIKRIYLEALENCDLILCKSEYEKEKYTQLGIKG